MSNDRREVALLKALDTGDYKTALAILASAVNAGFGHGFYADQIQKRGLCLCFRCDSASVADFRTLCTACQEAEDKVVAECPHNPTDRDHDECRCKRPRVFCHACSVNGPVFHVDGAHRHGWRKTP